MGRGTRPPRRGAIGADDFDTGRRGVRFGSGTGPSETVLRLFHVQPPDAGSAAPRDTSFRGTRDERPVFVPCHASLLSAGRNPRAHIRDGRKTEERCDLRAYRRTDGGRAEEAGVAIEVRHGHVESDRPASRGAGASESDFREALMLGDLAPNVFMDTSGSNSWIKYQLPDVTLKDVFRKALGVYGPNRLLFGTDSSFFPRGWNRAVFDAQVEVLKELAIEPEAARAILGGNLTSLLGG